jgi:hypothetical protein
MLLRFPGQYDEGNNVYQNVWRFYFPKIGRYSQPDPLHNRARYNSAIRSFISDSMRIQGNTREISGFLYLIGLYVYVENQPINFADHMGLFRIPVPIPGCGIGITIKARRMMDTTGTRFVHCWASCEITQACNSDTAEFYGFYKEVYDVAFCALAKDPKGCDSAFQDQDFKDNKFGRECPNKQCWDRCKDG